MNLNWPREEGADYYSGIISGENSVCLLAEVEGHAVGFLTGYVRETSSLRSVRLAELESMFVAGAFRGQEVGAELVGKFPEWCRARGVERVTVTAYWANENAVRFYKRLGFELGSVTLELGLD